MKKTFASLVAMNGLDDLYLNMIFIDIFATILPQEDVFKMVCPLLHTHTHIYFTCVINSLSPNI